VARHQHPQHVLSTLARLAQAEGASKAVTHNAFVVHGENKEDRAAV
jgi:hypothetical protein